jgi:hypothetical protein
VFTYNTADPVSVIVGPGINIGPGITFA